MGRVRRLLLVVCLWASLLQPGVARQMEKCQLARELMSHGMPQHELADWLCLAYHESRYDTAAEGRLNGDHTVDHGLFQISDLYWCDWNSAEPHRQYKNLCHARCDDFRDDDISDDLACVRQIHSEHSRLQGNGFMAWVAWRNFCNGASMAEYSASECDLSDTSPSPPRPAPAAVPAPVPTPRPARVPVPDPAPDPPTSLLPSHMTNGHTRRRPSSNVLKRTSGHDKSRLKPYRRGRTGWKAPQRTRQRQRVTWGPQLQKLVSTTPIPPRRRPSPLTSRWRPTSPSSSFTSSSSYSSSPGLSSFDSSSSSSGFSAASGGSYQGNVFLAGQAGYQGTSSSFRSPQNQGVANSFTPPRTDFGVSREPNPYPHNVFLANTASTSQSNSFQPGLNHPASHPFKNNVFLNGGFYQSNTEPEPVPVHPYPNNIFLNGGFEGANAARLPQPFEGNVFLKESIPSTQTGGQTRPASSGTPPARPVFGQNSFVSVQTANQAPAITTPRPYQPIFTTTWRPTTLSQPKTRPRFTTTRRPTTTTARRSTTTTTRRPTTTTARRPTTTTARRSTTTTTRRPTSTTTRRTTTPSRTTTQRPSTTARPRKITTKRTAPRRSTTQRPSTTTRPRTIPTRRKTPRRTTTQRPSTTTRPGTIPTRRTTPRRTTQQKPSTTSRPGTIPTRRTTPRHTTQQKPSTTTRPRTMPTRRTTPRRTTTTQSPYELLTTTLKTQTAPTKPTIIERPTTPRRPSTIGRFSTTQRPSLSAETTTQRTERRPTTARRPRTRRPAQRRRPKTTARPARHRPATSRPTTSTTKRPSPEKLTTALWDRLRAANKETTTVQSSTRTPNTRSPAFSRLTAKASQERSTTTRRPKTRRPARRKFPSYNPSDSRAPTTTRRPAVGNADGDRQKPSTASKGRFTPFRFTPIPKPTNVGPYGTWSTHGPGGRSWGFSFKG